jgi:hypothetical protein
MKPNDRPSPEGMLADDSPIDRIDEDLVAYLDGELEPQQRMELEARLGREPSLRARLRKLQAGWEMLGQLPEVLTNPKLLETTIRMAAIESTGSLQRFEQQRPAWWKTRSGMVSIASLVAFSIAVLGAKVWEEVRFRRELRLLPIAMRLDGYLHASDLVWMRELAKLPQWRETTTIAQRLGEWDFRLPEKIEGEPSSGRAALLRDLPLEDQQAVIEAWQRFEQLAPPQREAVLNSASEVVSQPDREELLATMERYARWRETLPPDLRDQINAAATPQRLELVATALKTSVSQWTQQSSRLLSDQDVETIYKSLHQIAERRVKTMEELAPNVTESVTRVFATIEPRTEAFFLRQLFRTPDQNGSGGVPRFDFLAPALSQLAPLLNQIRGPLTEDELYVIESVLGEPITGTLAAVADIGTLREDLLRSWAEESMRRMSWNRSGTTLNERYLLLDPARRDQLDLLPPSEIIQSLRAEDGRRRSFP